MQALTDWLSEVVSEDPVLWLAVAAGLLVLLGLMFFGARSSKRERVPIVVPNVQITPASWEDSLPSARHDERRRSIRRSGLPTPILVVDSKAGRQARMTEAYVLDRSTGGLRLAVEQPVPVGSTLLAKPSNAPDDFEWVMLEVRNCREVGDYFELGCEFESDLELNRLLMFG